MGVPAAPATTDPSVLALGRALEERVAGLWWLLLHESDSELSRTAAGVLAALATAGPLRVTELAEHEKVSQPTMSTILDRLERDGRVSRRPDPADGRARRIEITAPGRRLLELRASRRAEALGARLADLSRAERASLAAALPALDAVLRSA